jgi:hypothetical protein
MIRIRRIGKMPMPIDLKLTFKDSAVQWHNIPLNLMYGYKKQETPTSVKYVQEESWKWTHPTYTIALDRRLVDLKSVEVDPSKRMADVARKNNVLELNW